MKSYSQFLIEHSTDNSIALLSTELLYTIVLDESNSEEVIIEALNELYQRNELSEADLQKAMSGTIGSVPLSYIAKRKEGIAKQAELEKQSKAPPTKPFRMDEPNTTITKTPGGLVKFPVKTTDNTKGIPLTGKTFDPVKAALRGTVEPKSMPTVKSNVSQKQVLAKSSPTNTVTRSAKPVDTSAKSSPRPVTSKSTNPIIPKTVPKANNTVDKGYMNDLRGSAARMKSATSDLTKSTGRTVSALNKIAPSGRMERPTSKGGMTSSQIHSGIAKLGGEPTRSAPKAVPKVSKPASPPTLSASALKKNPSSGGGKWI